MKTTSNILRSELLEWSKQGIAINVGTDLRHCTFRVSRTEVNHVIRVFCVPLRQVCLVIDDYLVTCMKEWAEKFPKSGNYYTTIYIECDTEELYCTLFKKKPESKLTEIRFKEPIDQTGDDGVLDKVNEVLMLLYGEDCKLDWRDEYEVWVLHSDEDSVIDGTWRITTLEEVE